MVISRYLRGFINAPTDINYSPMLLRSLISTMALYPKNNSYGSSSLHVLYAHFTSTLHTTNLNYGMKIYNQIFNIQIFSKRLISVTRIETTTDTKNYLGKADENKLKNSDVGYIHPSNDLMDSPFSSFLSQNQKSSREDEKLENNVVRFTENLLSPSTYKKYSQNELQSSRKVTPLNEGQLNEFAPRIVVIGVGGAGGNAVNNMIARQLKGVDFLALNTDTQHLSTTLTNNRLQIGSTLTSGLGCGANPDAGRLAAEESREEITELLSDAHMVFITAGMGGGTGTGAAPVVAEICYNLGILTVGVVTKPFSFEGNHRMRLADEGITVLRRVVDTLIVIPNQNLFHLVDKSTSFMDSFAIADDVLLAGVKSITDLMTMPGLINLDFADVQSVMHGMGNAILGTGQAGILENYNNENESNKNGNVEYERSIEAAKQALNNPLLGDNMDIGTAKGMLVNITGGRDMTLWEVDRAAQCITEKVQDENANIIFGSAYDENLDGCIRVSVVATGINE